MVLPPKLPTIELFAASIGVTHKTLLNWCEQYPRFSDCYAQAMNMQKGVIQLNGAIKQYDGNFAKFLLVNNHGMTEQTKSDVTYRVVMDGEIDEESN